MTKKFILSIGLVLSMVSVLLGDVVSVSIPPAAGLPVGTNLIYGGPMRLLSITVSANTNATLRMFDSPYLTNQFTSGAFTNVTRTLGTVSNVYTSPFGVTYTNFYTNAISSTTNTLTAAITQRELIFASTFVSNTISTITFGAGKFLQGGLLVTNQPIPSPTPMIVTIEFEKIEQ